MTYMTFEPPAPSLQQQHHPQSNKKKSFKVTQKSNLNYLHLPLFAPEAKLNPFFYLFSMLSGVYDYLLPIGNIEYHASLQY